MSEHDDRKPSARVKERGHWRAECRLLPPAGEPPPQRPVTELLARIEAAQVRLRGWYLPHVSREEISYFATHIEGGSAWARYHERWRLYGDGQFLWEQALRDDWNENHAFDRRPNQLDRLNVIDTVFTLTELYRFCARLGKGWDGTAAVRMRVSLHGTKDRILWINDPARDGFHADNITRSLEIDAADEEYGLLDLIEGADALARTAAVRVFRAFGWEPQPGVIEGMQGELLRR